MQQLEQFWFVPSSRLPARLLIPALVSALLIPLLSAPALAAVTCDYDPATKVLQINLGTDDIAVLRRQGSEIRLQTAGPSTVTCTGGTPTVNNTDKINITGTAGANYLHIHLYGGQFAPGADDEPGGSDEIEIDVDLLGGSNQMFLAGGFGDRPLNVRAGTAGINLKPSEATGKDADLTIASGTDLQIYGNDDEHNIINASGGAGTGGQYPEELDIRGQDSSETLIGGAGNDFILAGGGKDLLGGGEGGDFIEGEEGRDTVTYRGTDGATVDLASGTVADDGTGSSDFLATVENVIGSANRDDLTGTDGRNKLVGAGSRDFLFGFDGNDRLLGRGGRDQLQGDTGDDYLHGGDRRDLCIGGPGSDTLRSCEL